MKKIYRMVNKLVDNYRTDNKGKLKVLAPLQNDDNIKNTLNRLFESSLSKFIFIKCNALKSILKMQ